MTNIAETGCQRLERLIDVFEAEIKRLERSVGVANVELQKLQAAEKIKVIQQKLTTLRA